MSLLLWISILLLGTSGVLQLARFRQGSPMADLIFSLGFFCLTLSLLVVFVSLFLNRGTLYSAAPLEVGLGIAWIYFAAIPLWRELGPQGDRLGRLAQGLGVFLLVFISLWMRQS